jgi:hypothetical protein
MSWGPATANVEKLEAVRACLNEALFDGEDDNGDLVVTEDQTVKFLLALSKFEYRVVVRR